MFAFITEPLFWVLGYVYMPYMSFKAIQTPDGKDDKEWLTTWVIYSMLSMLQTIPIISSIVGWIPFYYEVKLIVIVYCVFFKGAGVIYRKLIYPFFKRYERSADDLVNDLPGSVKAKYQELGHSEFVKNALTKGREFVLEHGPEAYSTVLAMAAQQAKEGTTQQEMGNIQSSVELGSNA